MSIVALTLRRVESVTKNGKFTVQPCLLWHQKICKVLIMQENPLFSYHDFRKEERIELELSFHSSFRVSTFD